MSWRQQEENEFQRWYEEAHWLSLDGDRRYLAWLEYEHQRLIALIESMERQNGNV